HTKSDRDWSSDVCSSDLYAGIRQRWVVVYSPEAYQRAIKRVDRHCLQQSTAELKAFEVLCRREFACRVDAEQALAEFKKPRPSQIGRASCRERVKILVVQ